uniref:Transcription factor grauzone n=1 Tax=Anopheles epiroticus TaxID=199890 RepID=A0A182PN80_9DIPT
MNEICRLCLESLPFETAISIRDQDFQEKLKGVFHFEIAHDALLPEHVCHDCRSTVLYCHSYFLQVRTNQDQLVQEAKELILQPEENDNLESLFDANCFEMEEHKLEDGSDIMQEDAFGPLEGLEQVDLPERTAEQDTCAKEESKSRWLENDQIIKDFIRLECEICAATSESFALLLDHYRTVHETKGYVRCCEKQFFRRYMLVDHIAAHRGTIRCDICQKAYKTKRYLALHTAKSHSRVEDRPFKCSKCHVSFPKQYLLRAHEVLHIQQRCQICHKVLSSIQSLKVHMVQMHSDDGKYICDTCGKVFRTKPAMDRHINEHLGLDVVQRVQCEYCQKWFNGKYNLSKHVRFLHKEGGQLFPCDSCQHVSPNSRALANHKQRVHVEERFECEYCGKRFKRRPNLREHVASHTNVPLYSCEICNNRTFNSKANYFTHRKSKHPHEWEAQKPAPSEMDEKCRLCSAGCNSTGTTPITDVEFGAKLEMVFTFPVLPEEPLPERVCQECVAIVSDFHTYSQRVKSHQEQLRANLKEQKFEPFEVVKIEALEDDDYYDIEMEEQMEVLQQHEEIRVTVTRKPAKQVLPSHTADSKSVPNAQEEDDPEEEGEEVDDDEDDDDEDDEDFVPKVDPKDGTLKVPVRRRRHMKQMKVPPKKRTVKTEKQSEKLEPEELDKQNEEDKRIQEFYKFECEICSQPMDSFVYLQGHYRREHGTKGYIRCCDKLFYRRFQLLDHIAAHQGTIKCEVCQKSYKSSRYLALHMMKSHSREEDRPFKCDKCHQSFHKEHLLKAHQANHLSEKCPICEKVVSSKYALKAHVSHMHGSDSNQICDVCGKEFRTKQAMERHINEHMGVEVVQKVQCHVCQRWFHGKYNLRKHIRFMHIEGGKVFPCDLCSHESPNSRALLDHKKRVHVVERFECELCGKRFKRKLYLREHIASHTGQPLYECGICDAKFNSNANCYNHRKSKHPEEWQARRQAFFEAQRKAPDTALKKEQELECTIGVSITDESFQRKLQTVFSFELSTEQALPEQVCQQCQTTVDEFHVYSQQVEANQQQLKSAQPVEDVAQSRSFDSVKEEPDFKIEIISTNETAEELPLGIECVDVKEEYDEGMFPESDLEIGSESGISAAEAEAEAPRRKGRRKARERKVKNKEKEDGNSQARLQEKDERIKEFYTLECEICSILLDDFVQLLEHYQLVHDTRGYIRCCNKQLFHRYTLLDHIAVHRGTIRCEVCDRTYKTKRYLALHMAKSHGTDEERPYKCSKCALSYPKEYLLRSHMLMHVQAECNICSKVLSSNYALKVHLNQVHSDDANQICATCGKMFRTKAAMFRHIKEHMGLEPIERMKCEYCQKWFNGKYNLNKHVRFLHNEQGQVFRCDICGHESPNSRALSYHKQRVHVEERFECEYCGKRFKRKLYLREHIAVHTNVPLYTCEYCGMQFNSHANHFTHRKNKHPEEWEAHKRMRMQKKMSKNQADGRPCAMD